MKKRFLGLLILVALVLLLPASALAQSYSFGLERETVNVYWNSDGTESIDYVFAFNNDPTGHAIEYVDVGLPNSNFVENSISADVNGNPVSDISASGFEGTGSGVAVGLGRYTIPPGQSGEVHVFIGTVQKVLRPDSKDNTYASAVFAPAWFEGTVHGTTNLSVTFHLPPGVQPDEPRWHAAPSGWAQEPATGLDNQGRVTYTWSNAKVVMNQKYEFGASFPKTYVPASAISNPSLFESLGISADAVIPFLFCGGVGLFILITMFAGIRGSQKRKLQYLPPKIAIEGHGIKRGLTAIEAAILLEEPMDKILTMILFAVIKKGAAKVTTRDPLKLDILQPQPEDLQPYEKQFVEAFAQTRPAARRSDLQDLMINLVKSVAQKMKGFSRKETVAYYRDIMKRAWAQVEAADTPEVKSQKYDDVMEWTMLDRDYERRTQDVFRGGPVFVPIWWGRFDPGYGRSAAPQTASMPSAPGGGGGISLPHLPGSDFAASVVRGTQSFSSSVVGNLTDFTSKVTNKTNPVPVSTSRGGGSYRGGGGGCACACACAGCACACAGGGR
jgi:hypothetical protein